MADTDSIAVDGPEAEPARILVVDDNLINRKKIQMAVRNLGHETAAAEDGERALESLRSSPFDAVLLDIMMPGIDGFGVLKILKADPALRDIPVIVISALDDDSASVVKAIEFGAEDFLPKSFDLVLLRARLNASLAKKRFRDQELAYFRRVDRLTEAAEVMESGEFEPRDLKLDDLASYNDSLGRLSAVFRGMAEEIFDREKRLQRTIQLLQGSLVVIAIGIIWGVVPSLSRLASNISSSPFGMAVWVNLISAGFCLGVAAYRGPWPRLTLSDLWFFLLWSLINGVLTRLTMFWVAEHVEATVLALIATLQSFLVLAFAAATRSQRVSLRRLAGVLVGLAGVTIVLLTRIDPSANASHFWLLVALALPVLYALEWALLGAKLPQNIDIVASVGIMMLTSTILILPMAYASDDWVSISNPPGRLELLLVLIAATGAASLVCCLYLVKFAGAIFASLSAYLMTIAGIIWGMLLLDEVLSPLAWSAVAMILIGLYLVEPDAASDKVVLKRSFVRTDISKDT